jgi:hypothetical protein
VRRGSVAALGGGRNRVSLGAGVLARLTPSAAAWNANRGARFRTAAVSPRRAFIACWSGGSSAADRHGNAGPCPRKPSLRSSPLSPRTVGAFGSPCRVSPIGALRRQLSHSPPSGRQAMQIPGTPRASFSRGSSPHLPALSCCGSPPPMHGLNSRSGAASRSQPACRAPSARPR